MTRIYIFITLWHNAKVLKRVALLSFNETRLALRMLANHSLIIEFLSGIIAT